MTTNAGDRLIPPRQYDIPLQIETPLECGSPLQCTRTRPPFPMAWSMNCLALIPRHTRQEINNTIKDDIWIGASRGEKSNQILFFIIFNIQHHIVKMFRKARSYRECLFRIADTDARWTEEKGFTRQIDVKGCANEILPPTCEILWDLLMFQMIWMLRRDLKEDPGGSPDIPYASHI